MANVYDKLRTLQEILSKKFDVEREISDIPKALATKTELLNRLKKSYIDKNEAFGRMSEKTKALSDGLTFPISTCSATPRKEP